MKVVSHTLLLILFAACFTACNLDPKTKTDGPHLLVIWENNKAGFVDENGKVIIPPKFNAANDFSQGLANVRENGLYGYINARGEYEIPPVFEYATPFSNGMAIVYKGEKAFYIQRDGKVAFKRSFIEPEPFSQKGWAIIGNTKWLKGVIDLSGHLILDTVYTDIRFNNNRFIVHTKDFAALTDSLGRLVVPLERYVSISALNNDYYAAETSNNQSFVINNNGQVIFTAKDGYSIQAARSNDHIVLMKNENNQVTVALADLHGTIKYIDTSGGFTMGRFSSNRFMIANNGLISVFTPEGRQIGPAFQRIYDRQFFDGYAFAAADDKYGIIDTNARFVSKARFDNIQQADCGAGCFIYSEYVDGNELFGIGQLKGKKILPPVMETYDDNGFVNGVLRGVIKGRLALIDSSGKIIWQDKSQLHCTNLNIDYQQGFYMHVDQKDDPRFREGTFKLDSSRPVTHPGVPLHQLSILIDVSKTDTFQQVYNGYNVYVSNKTDKAIEFSIQDYHLYSTMQALNSKNEWQDIEYIPSSWCGNSYSDIMLPVNECWLLKCPVYEGSIKTKLRLAVKTQRNMPPVYSNIIDGSINPAQFWRIKSHFSNNIMDPYNPFQ